MATGDQTDFLQRLHDLIPPSWFPTGESPVLDTVLSGSAFNLAWTYSIFQYVLKQARIATATGVWLDRISYDFLGTNLPRFTGETDVAYRARIIKEILRERDTRKGVILALQDLTGITPKIYEPWHPGDEGAYSDYGGINPTATTVNATFAGPSTPFTGSPTPDLAYWTLDNANVNWSTPAILDTSGNNNTGTPFHLTSANTVAGQSGYNQALNCAGIGQFVSSVQFTNPLSFTIACWFNTTVADGHKIIGFENTTTDTGSVSYDRHIYMDTNGLIQFGIFTGSLVTVPSLSTLTDGKWHHAVGTYDGTTIKLYIDGVLQGSATGTAQLFNGFWRVGGYKLNAWNNASDGYFSGLVDDVRVYSSVLSAAQVTQLFNGNAGVITSGFARGISFSGITTPAQVTMGYDVAGMYGDLNLNDQVFVTAFRPISAGIANVAGYDMVESGYDIGGSEYIEDDWISGQITDAMIYATVAKTIAAGITAWVNIETFAPNFISAQLDFGSVDDSENIAVIQQ